MVSFEQMSCIFKLVSDIASPSEIVYKNHEKLQYIFKGFEIDHSLRSVNRFGCPAAFLMSTLRELSIAHSFGRC